jgi:hypothetical protein
LTYDSIDGFLRQDKTAIPGGFEQRQMKVVLDTNVLVSDCPESKETIRAQSE